MPSGASFFVSSPGGGRRTGSGRTSDAVCRGSLRITDGGWSAGRHAPGLRAPGAERLAPGGWVAVGVLGAPADGPGPGNSPPARGGTATPRRLPAAPGGRCAWLGMYGSTYQAHPGGPGRPGRLRCVARRPLRAPAFAPAPGGTATPRRLPGDPRREAAPPRRGTCRRPPAGGVLGWVCMAALIKHTPAAQAAQGGFDAWRGARCGPRHSPRRQAAPPRRGTCRRPPAGGVLGWVCMAALIKHTPAIQAARGEFDARRAARAWPHRAPNPQAQDPSTRH